MSSLRLLVVTVCLVGSTGCGPVTSLHPLWTNKQDIVFEPNLLGTWTFIEPRRTLVLVFEKAENEGYKVTFFIEDYIESKRSATRSEFSGYLVRSGSHLFLDVTTHENVWNEITANERLVAVVPAHWVFRIVLREDALQVAYLDTSSLEQGIKKGEVEVDHEWVGEHENVGMLLTASTEDLKALYLRYVEDFELFPYPASANVPEFWQRSRVEPKSEK